MTYLRKTRDEWTVQVDYGYGHGWEDETTEDSRAEGRERLREYRANCQYACRLVKRRVPITPDEARALAAAGKVVRRVPA